METPTDNPEIAGNDSEAWGEVTDPKQHDPSKFRYLVHAINPMATATMGFVGAILKDELTSEERSEGDQTINLYLNPEKLGSRVALSSSLVDQEHHGTWGDAGLIYEAPPENVLITSPQDVGAVVMNRKRLEEQASKHRRLTADELLKQTYHSSHNNEVVVLANKDDKKVRLTGFFYKATAEGTPKNEVLYQTFRRHAERLDLPLIPITEPNPYAENKINRSEDRFSVQYGGRLYNLEDSPDRRFRSYGQSGYSVFTPPDEVERVFGYLQENNVSQDDVDRLRAEYQEVDKVRQQPKVTYDEHGNITVVEKRSGYGIGERKVTIRKGGYARSVNVIEEAKKLSEMMEKPTGHQLIEPYDRSVASPHEAEQVIRETIALVPEEEKQRVTEWWNLVKENVQRHWDNNQRSRQGFYGKSRFSAGDS